MTSAADITVRTKNICPGAGYHYGLELIFLSVIEEYARVSRAAIVK